MTDVIVPVVETLEMNLQNQLTRLSAQYDQDILFIGEQLLQEATERGWCSDFDKFVKRLNTSLHRELITRVKTYRVEKKITVTIYQSVDATSEEDADFNSDAIDISTNSAWEVDDWDVEETTCTMED